MTYNMKKLRKLEHSCSTDLVLALKLLRSTLLFKKRSCLSNNQRAIKTRKIQYKNTVTYNSDSFNTNNLVNTPTIGCDVQAMYSIVHFNIY